MTIFYDGIHAISDTSLEELHQWAAAQGISRNWFEGLKKGHPHYDMPKRRRGEEFPMTCPKTKIWLVRATSKELVIIMKAVYPYIPIRIDDSGVEWDVDFVDLKIRWFAQLRNGFHYCAADHIKATQDTARAIVSSFLKSIDGDLLLRANVKLMSRPYLDD